MQYDQQLTLSAAGSRHARRWPQQTLWWSEFVQRLQTPARSPEVLQAYLRLPKSQQDDLKDVGGFVGGALAGGRRKANAVLNRCLVTLDCDAIPPDGTDDVLRRADALGCAYAVYSTRKHEPIRPRLRVIIPLARPATPDEYEPIARRLAEHIGLDLCDLTTFQTVRLMYWPSCCQDSQYVFSFGDKPFADPDGLLSTYADWRDTLSWPQVPGFQKIQQKQLGQQEDPTTKPGVVGAFCRCYDIRQAIDQFLPGVYESVENASDRFTYTGGSTTGGALVYGDLYLYSHHATDPASGRLVNAFDLVRLHKYAEQDDEAKDGTPTSRLPSYQAMKALAMQDDAVSALVMRERYEATKEDFGIADEDAEEPTDWLKLLDVDSDGIPRKTIDNVVQVLEHDPALRGRLVYDEFANRGITAGGLPWDNRAEARPWTDADDAGIMHYLEHRHKIQIAENRMFAGMTVSAQRHRRNEVQSYLNALRWDGVERLNTLLTDYLGAVDNAYTRAVARKSLAAAVARAMVPGTKYDQMPILTGPQGIGKSTLLRKLGRAWYSDSLQTFEGKEACELVQGQWIIEIGELNGFSRADVRAIKQFLSRTEDIFREPYGRRTNAYPRRCVFFGTTNDEEFLRDRTGNRRFWPVRVPGGATKKSVFRELDAEIDQIWAEAVVAWKMGEPLYMDGEAEEIAKLAQEQHTEGNAKEGLIRDFLAAPIPLDWDMRDAGNRRLWFSGALQASKDTAMRRRDRVCALEVWCECFQQEKSKIRQADTREINEILASFDNTQSYEGPKRFGPYGLQRGFALVDNWAFDPLQIAISTVTGGVTKATDFQQL